MRRGDQMNLFAPKVEVVPWPFIGAQIRKLRPDSAKLPYCLNTEATVDHTPLRVADVWALPHVFFSMHAGSGALLSATDEQPVVEAVHNGHERGLVEVAAYARSDPGFVPIGVKAGGNAHMRR